MICGLTGDSSILPTNDHHLLQGPGLDELIRAKKINTLSWLAEPWAVFIADT